MRRVLLATVFVFALLFVASHVAAPARAGDDEPTGGHAASGAPGAASEVWRFRKGEAERTVDVTGLPEVVREAVVARMAADGYARAEPSAVPGTGRDLEADARELVRRGGRFPDRDGVRPRPDAGGRGPAAGALLGARVRLESAGETARLRVLDAPDGSLAQAIGLVRGDRILALDGAAPTLEVLARYRAVERAPGQLALRVLRREDRTEEWILTFSRGASPESR